MKKNTTSLMSLGIIYLLMFILQVIALPASKYSVLLLILTGAIGSTHIHFAKRRNEKINWSQINRPFAVVDWGQDGKAFELPERHNGFYIACPASQVEDTTAFVTYSLSSSGNAAYIKSDMPVLHFYFGWGAHVLETQDEYKARVVAAMDKALVEWHEKLQKEEKAYVRAFFAGNQNGSANE